MIQNFGKGKGQPTRDPNGAGFPSKTDNPSGPGRGNNSGNK